MKRKRGFALTLTLLVLPLIALLAFTLTTIGVNSHNVSRIREDSRRGQYCAEAGAEEAFQRLKDDTTYSGTFTRNQASSNLTAQVRVTNNAEGSSTIRASNGADVPVGFAYVLSSCKVQSARIDRTFGMLVRITGASPSPWNYAAFGYDSIDLTGNASTDSYSSAGGGTYATTRIGFGSPNALTQGGHVGTNNAAGGSVNFSGVNAQVGGRIDIGRNGVPSTVVSGSSGVNYTAGQDAIQVLTAKVAKPPVVVPQLPTGTFSTSGVLPPNYKYGNIQLSGGNTLTLGNGVYVFDGIKLAGQAQIVLAPGASAQVYITGNNGGGLDLSGQGVANLSGIAERLTFYGGPDLTSEISVTGNASAYFRLYAPNTPVKIAGNGDIFGSLVGQTVRNVGNAKIHYDRSMGSPPIPPDANVTYRQRF